MKKNKTSKNQATSQSFVEKKYEINERTFNNC